MKGTHENTICKTWKDSAQHRGGWSQLDLLPEGKREAEELADYLV